MAEVAKATSFAPQSNRGNTSTAYEYVQSVVAAAAGTVAVQAPAGGKLVQATLAAGGDAHDASNNYSSVTVINKSNSDAAMVTALDTGVSTISAYGSTDFTLSTTAANLLVDQHDVIEITTLTADAATTDANSILLIFEITD